MPEQMLPPAPDLSALAGIGHPASSCVRNRIQLRASQLLARSFVRLSTILQHIVLLVEEEGSRTGEEGPRRRVLRTTCRSRHAH